MSLAQTHQEMQTLSLKIGLQCEPPACGRRFTLDPNFSRLGPHFLMCPCQTHGIPPLLLVRLEAYIIYHTKNYWIQQMVQKLNHILASPPPMHPGMSGGVQKLKINFSFYAPLRIQGCEMGCRS